MINNLDPDLVKNGDRRNVVDKYRNWTVESIKADLASKSVSLQIAIENLEHDLNIGSIVRSANAFNVDTVHIIGKRHWNRRGAMVTDRYLKIIHHSTVADFEQSVRSEGYAIIAIEVNPDAKRLNSESVPKKTVFVFGNESNGLSRELLSIADNVLKIEQFGSTRSINVSVAAGIAMYVWRQQHDLLSEDS